jgi:Acyl-CoA thioesterase C-terminal domain/Acyl-CoA thioesterase N-terminal domain
MTERALFVRESNVWIPTEFARGPWTPEALHGGPVAALVARAAEECEPDPDLRLTRLTVELLRPVPVAPLEVTATLSRPGRKVQLIDVRVSSAGVDLAWGRALRIRALEPGTVQSGELRSVAQTATVREDTGSAPPPPEEGRSSAPLVEGYVAFHSAGAELRFVRGEFATRGPASVWVRLAVPVVAGEEPSPVQRAAAAADFGNGVSSALDFSSWIFINPDLSVVLHRPPQGEWVCLEASTRLGVPGTGVAQCVLWDSEGCIGRSLQTLLVEPR